MIINHNMSAINANRVLGLVNSNVQDNIAKLSSGMRINSAGDDPSGLAVSEKMRAQIQGLNQAQRNTMDGVSLIQTSEGFLEETTDIVQRIRELSVQAANGIYTDEDRMMIQVEVSQLVDEIDRIANHAQFNGMNILLGDYGRESEVTTEGAPAKKVMQIQIGANMDQNERIYIENMNANALGLYETEGGKMLSVATIDSANDAIGIADAALKTVTKQRVDLGAYQNRLEEAAKGIAIASENTQAAESRIRDVNMATEMTDYIRNNILTQSGTAMLAQANMKTQSVLQLF